MALRKPRKAAPAPEGYKWKSTGLAEENRKKRLALAKARVQKLVDAGVPFNPKGVSQFTRDRAGANLRTGKVGSRAKDSRRQTRRSQEFDLQAGGRSTSMSAPRLKPNEWRPITRKGNW
jgi:hypothetical protein